MSNALELQDRALAIARDGVVLSSEPVSTRHLASLGGGSTQPEVLSSVEAQLRSRLAADDVLATGPFWCATSAAIDPTALGAVLAIARRSGAAVAGLIDAATVSAASVGLQRDALVLEVGLYHLAVTSIAAGRVIRKRRSVVSPQSGWIALCNAWLDLIRSAMVNRTRLDPLRHVDAERELFTALPALVREAAATGTSVAEVQLNGQTMEIPVTRDQLADAAQPVIRELGRLIAQLRTPGSLTDIIAPLAIASLPGFDSALERMTGAGARQLLLPDGFAAAAASLRMLPNPTKPGVVPFVRRVGAEEHESLRALIVQREMAVSDGRRRASHVLYQGQAFAFRGGPVVVGRRGAEDNSIVLPQNSAGVSRRHCTFTATGDDVSLVDHSQFGTFVNGERIVERARLHPGDQVSIGEPGFELAVIAVD